MQPTKQTNQLLLIFFLNINNTIILVPLYSCYSIDSLPVHDAAGKYSPRSSVFLGFCQGTGGP